MVKQRQVSEAKSFELTEQFAELIRLNGLVHATNAVNKAFSLAVREVTQTAPKTRGRGRPVADANVAEVAWFMIEAHIARNPNCSVLKAATALGNREGILNGYAVRTLRSFHAAIEKQHAADRDKGEDALGLGIAERDFLNGLKPSSKA